MVRFAEGKAAVSGFTSMVLHARKTAVRFYETLGYAKVGTEFIEINIPHFEMRKSIG
jgi:predicted GNAT family N-acyltransferase